MKNQEIDKWPFIFKLSVVFGIGLIALENTYIGLQIAGSIKPNVVENIGGFLFGVVGIWRVAEPNIMMYEKRHPESIGMFTTHGSNETRT